MFAASMKMDINERNIFCAFFEKYKMNWKLLDHLTMENLLLFRVPFSPVTPKSPNSLCVCAQTSIPDNRNEDQSTSRKM